MSLFDNYRDKNNPKYDKYLPIADNLNLQQYDNYCIYDMAAITYYYYLNDTYYFHPIGTIPIPAKPEVAELDSWVAWQKFDVMPITLDFRILVDRYRDPDIE